jgi:hypothetical protein
MIRNGASFVLFSLGEMGHRTMLLRLSAVLRNAVVMYRPRITPDNCRHKTTWPEFQPSLPPGLFGGLGKKPQYALRAGVESSLSQGIRRVDLRRSRDVGLARMHLQQLLTATAMPVVRVIAWLWGEPLGERRQPPGPLAQCSPHPWLRQTVLCEGKTDPTASVLAMCARCILTEVVGTYIDDRAHIPGLVARPPEDAIMRGTHERTNLCPAIERGGISGLVPIRGDEAPPHARHAVHARRQPTVSVHRHPEHAQKRAVRWWARLALARCRVVAGAAGLDSIQSSACRTAGQVMLTGAERSRLDGNARGADTPGACCCVA